MSWGLAVLLIILFICFSVLLFLVIPEFINFAEIYFIIVIIALFIILIFAIDFDNPITTTLYISKNLSSQRSYIYSVPYQDDEQYSNLMTLTFNGVYTTQEPNNITSYTDTVTFNYDTFTDAVITSLGNKIKVTKLPNYQIQLDIDPNAGGVATLDGYLTMSLLCTGSQSINGKFSQV